MTGAVTGSEVAGALEAAAPRALQEEYDNCGWQVGDPEAPVTGVLVCVDSCEERVTEALARGCNLIVTHHPLLFRGLKSITGRTEVERTVMAALRAGVAIYSLHTCLDNAPDPYGVSLEMARMIGLQGSQPLTPGGSGAIGALPEPLAALEAVELVKRTFGSPVARCNRAVDDGRLIKTIALCSGSGSSLTEAAADAGADMYVTSDTGYHRYTDHRHGMLICDIGHYESENCTKGIISRIIREKFPNFAVEVSTDETNPIVYV